MLQVVQHQKTGVLSIAELPAPQLRPGTILVRTAASLISAGTERTSVETAQSSMLGRAKKHPELVKQVIRLVKTEGLLNTYKKVQSRLENYKELGYSSAGIVLASDTPEFSAGDWVACGGGGASHAELVVVPRNLAVKIPAGVSLEEGAFATIGAIAMQGIRQADLRIGETVAVLGLGLIGLITVQLARAAGCRVIGLDVKKTNFDLARALGCEACVTTGSGAAKAVHAFTRGYGTDAVIITAGTSSNEPMVLSLAIARKKSKIVVVGAVGMNIPRSPFYEKELDLRISCSYGPGRYDPSYEEDGHDYPIGYVRWTENRNMASFLDLVAGKQIDVQKLITHRIPLADALTAYDYITGKKKANYLGIVLEYPGQDAAAPAGHPLLMPAIPEGTPKVEHRAVVGFIGAGNFAQSNLLPPLKDLGVRLRTVVTQSPVHAKATGGKFGFEFFGTDTASLLSDDSVNTVFITTRHDSHARYVINALNAGKHVFVEKPLAVLPAELDELCAVRAASPGCHLLTGFNRRFSKPFRDIRELFKGVREPLNVIYRVNAGFVPTTSWVQGEANGGRIIGEVCHFIDTISFLTGSLPRRVYAEALETRNADMPREDNISITVKYENGSVGTIVYLANGDSALPKEYCEVSGGGIAARMENFRTVTTFRGESTSKRSYDGTKGHREELEHFIALVTGGASPEISFESMVRTTRATFRIREALRAGTPLEIAQ